MDKIIKNFKPFWFDGNQWFGFVDTPKKAKDLLKHYSYEELRRARSFSGKFNWDEVPRFGFYREYRGDLNLGQWIDANNQTTFYKLLNKYTVTITLIIVGIIILISVLVSLGVI